MVILLRLGEELGECFIGVLDGISEEYCNGDTIKFLRKEVKGMLVIMGCTDDNYYGEHQKS